MKTDLTFLKKIAVNDSGFLLKIIDELIKQSPPMIESMQEACRNKDWQKVRTSAHKLSSSIELTGNQELKDLVKKIEQFAREESNLEILPVLVHQVHEICESVFIELENEKYKLLNLF